MVKRFPILPGADIPTLALGNGPPTSTPFLTREEDARSNPMTRRLRYRDSATVAGPQGSPA
jgi:hypothetical protein